MKPLKNDVVPLRNRSEEEVSGQGRTSCQTAPDPGLVPGADRRKYFIVEDEND
jgi:hypothetical protein